MASDIPIYLVPRESYSHLASLLLPHIAQTLVLLRHLQWSHAPPQASIYTTFPFVDPNGVSITTLPRTFCAARFDRSAFRGQNLYIFSSLELDLSAAKSPLTPTDKLHATAQLLALLAHLHRIDNPFYDFAIPSATIREADTGMQGSITDRILVGSLHSSTAQLLEQHGLIHPGAHAYNKYVLAYNPTGTLPPLPEGIAYTTITAANYNLVMANNSLIRDPQTFANCPTAAIRLVSRKGSGSGVENEGQEGKGGEGELIAWAFLTGYGSVRSLHVQPEYRGRGLARKVVLKLLEDAWPAEFVSAAGGERSEPCEERERIFHTDIDPENEASIRTFVPVGGVMARSQRYWVDVDLAGAEGALEMLMNRGGG